MSHFRRKEQIDMAKLLMKNRIHETECELMCSNCGYAYPMRKKYADIVRFCPNRTCHSGDVVPYDEELHNEWKNNGHFDCRK